MMLHNEARELAVKAANGKHSMKEVAEMFGVCPSTIYRLKKKMKETGNVSLCLSTRGRKPCLTPQNITAIEELLQSQADITIAEITKKLGLQVSDETVRKAVINLGYRLKKKAIHASEQERPRCENESRTMVWTRKKESGQCR